MKRSKILFILYINTLVWACSPALDEKKAQKTSQPSADAGKAKKSGLEGITRIDTVKYTAEDSLNYALYEPLKSSLWDTLRDIKYDKEGVYGHIPHFGAKQKPLHGKQVRIQGYMHPLKEGTNLQKWFMLSYFPSSSCFFCGAAGPETAIEVKSPKGVIYKRDKLITIRGTLNLNFDEPERLFYILEGAVQE